MLTWPTPISSGYERSFGHEILQGIAGDTTHWRYLGPLLMLPMPDTVFVRAADIYRKLRKSGITIRMSNNCIIAAAALEHHAQLLHNDKNFWCFTCWARTECVVNWILQPAVTESKASTCLTSAWRNLSDAGFTQGHVAISQGTQKVLACTAVTAIP